MSVAIISMALTGKPILIMGGQFPGQGILYCIKWGKRAEHQHSCIYCSLPLTVDVNVTKVPTALTHYKDVTWTCRPNTLFLP